MLCHVCHIHVRRDFPYCLNCGTLRRGAKTTQFEAPRLVLGDKTVAVTGAVTTIGRDADNDLVIDEPSVSRHHARVVRRDTGFSIEDLGSSNGTSVGDRTLHGAAAALNDRTQLHIGDVPVTFEQPRTLAVGGLTMRKATQHTMLAVVTDAPPVAETATEPLSARPRQRSGWALKRIPDDRQRERWVLSNTRNGRFLELDARDVFIWSRLDGTNTIRDLLYLYAQEYSELALPRIERLLRALVEIDVIRGMPGQESANEPSLLRRIAVGIFTVLFRAEISIRGIDGVVGRLYRGLGWRLFTRTAAVVLWVLVGAGLYAFWQARTHQKLFNVGGAGIWGGLAVAVLYLLALMLHELTHALAVKSYGRRLTRGGFMLMMGMPFAFVDTSDMWFGSRWSRLVVTLSGPLSTAGFAGFAALVANYVPNAVVAGVAYQLAFALYLNTLYNFNPLMPLDGYQALSDALRMPRLRQEAMSYVAKGMWRDVARRHRPGVREFGLTLYGAGAVAATYLFLALGVLAWRTRIGGFVHRHVNPPFDTVIVVLGIGLAMFPVWVRLLRGGIALIRQLARRRGGAPAAETAEAVA